MTTDVTVPVAGVDIRPEDVEAMSAVLCSGRLRQGQVVARFEEAFAARVGARYAVAVSSGTAALHLSYLALFRPGDEVIVPSFTFVATASMLAAVGAVPVFADVDARTFTLPPEEVTSRLTARTRGVVGVHLFGNACDVDGLAEVAADRGLTLVWDAAQALGTEYRGRDVGGYSRAACYSFYPTKAITTGEGGMVTTDDPELAAALRLSRSQGAQGKYVHTSLGFNYRMTDFQAALGLRQLERLDEYLARRRANAGQLSACLRDVDGVVVPEVTERARHSFNQYSILVRPPLPSRDGVASLLAAAGVETAVHYPRPLHRQPLFNGWPAVSLTNSELLATEILALPVHPALTTSQMRTLTAALTGVVGGRASNGAAASARR
ncbi:MAG TPA: DegT/DnrJ/EryC1/StrS family aminotransferase [Acidimicrobiales bacterium]|nr:DegT/DnrJ/EryC1/StrS family aminotransferase [Acidimicrobiales bacterium]